MGLGVGIGTGVQVDDVLSDAVSVEVYECVGTTTRYTIRYDIDIDGGEFKQLTDDKLSPGSELTLQVSVADRTDFLVKGPVRGHSVHFQHGGGESYLEVRGADVTAAMDRESKVRQWNGKDSDVVTKVVEPYLPKPDVAPTDSLHDDAHHAVVQRETDLALVRRLAARNGMLFWLTYDAEAVAKAHFQLPPVAAPPSASLLINDREGWNVRSFDLQFDVEHPTSAEAIQLDPRTKTLIDASTAIPRVASLGKVPFAAIASGTRRSHLAAPVDDLGDLTARASAMLQEASFFVSAECDTTTADLGAVVHAHQVVSVQGLGTRHSGNYLVRSVHHLINARGHHMHISLARNGWDA